MMGEKVLQARKVTTLNLCACRLLARLLGLQQACSPSIICQRPSFVACSSPVNQWGLHKVTSSPVSRIGTFGLFRNSSPRDGQRLRGASTAPRGWLDAAERALPMMDKRVCDLPSSLNRNVVLGRYGGRTHLPPIRHRLVAFRPLASMVPAFSAGTSGIEYPRHLSVGRRRPNCGALATILAVELILMQRAQRSPIRRIATPGRRIAWPVSIRDQPAVRPMSPSHLWFLALG